MSSWKLPSTAGRPVAIVGTGVLGRRIAACWAASGYKVNIYDNGSEQLDAALQFVRDNIRDFSSTATSDTLDLHGFHDLQGAVEQAWLVIECVPERLDLKVDVFAKLEELAPPDAILATNSSSYKSREVTAGIRPETARRVLNVHYYMPPMIRVVELMTSGSTHESIIPFVAGHLRKAGAAPFVARKESTGFIYNRVWAAIKRESLMVLAEGVCTPAELDDIFVEIMKTGMLGTLGPCAQMDQVGLDTVALIEQHYVAERGAQDTSGLRYLQGLVDEGRLGEKSSKGGFYTPEELQKRLRNLDDDNTNSTNGTNGIKNDDNDNKTNTTVPIVYFLEMGLLDGFPQVSNNGRIFIGSGDGKTPLRTLVAGQYMPDGIALCPSIGRIVWTNMGFPWMDDGHLMSCNMDGSDVRVIIPPGVIHTPKQLIFDPLGEKLYLCDREGMRVMRCNADGTELETLVQRGNWRADGFGDPMRWCVGVAVAPRQGKFYWTQKGPPKGGRGRLFRASIVMPPGCDATSRTDIECLATGLPEPTDLEVDEDDGVLYWADRGELPFGNSLNRASIALPLLAEEEAKQNVVGTRIRLREHAILAQNLHEGIGIALDKRNRHVYVTDFGGAVYRFDMGDGGNKRKLYEDQGAYTGIALAFDS